MTISITAIGCLHGHFPELEGGDLLIVTGDITGRDTIYEWAQFFNYLKQQDYRKKILIGGNHDNFLSTSMPETPEEAEICKQIREICEDEEPDFEYLCDSGIEFNGLKIWGSPRSLIFPGINPKCTAFTGYEVDLKKKWDQIPDDIDILITHTPPFGILDQLGATEYHASCGSMTLSEACDRVKPKIHIFSHIHEQGGKKMVLKRPGHGVENNTICVNCSIMNENYEPVNTPIRIEI